MGASSPLLSEERKDASTIDVEWRVQRIGWVVLTLIVVAALAGLFGTGPMSWSSASAPDGSLTVEYSRFSRNRGPIAMGIHVDESAAVDGQVQVFFSQALLDTLELPHITPEPRSQVSTGDGVVMSFVLEGDVPLEATVSATGQAMGFQDGAVGLAGRPPLRFWRLFYP